MKTFEPGTDNPSLFACEPAGMDTKKDFWSPKCGWGCGQGRDSKFFTKVHAIHIVSSIMEPSYVIMTHDL